MLNRPAAAPINEERLSGCAGRQRVVIEQVRPSIEDGRYPIKRIIGDEVVVDAVAFADGHDLVAATLVWRHEAAAEWNECPMEPTGPDCWRGRFWVDRLGRFLYSVLGRIDRFRTWRRDLEKRIQANQDPKLDLIAGAQVVRDASARAKGTDRRQLCEWADKLGSADVQQALAASAAPELPLLMDRYADRKLATRYHPERTVVVDRERAGFGAWYEVFPRSCSPQLGRHGTFGDLERWLPYIAQMGFDVLYLPPIHPIGRAFRKGRNNKVTASAEDVGSPWAIGSAEGGHKSIHPALGTLEDFQHLLEAARGQGLELALDIAFQTSPDHPYVNEHPEWFRHRADGTIQYAENPPKKYQDIYPFDFETEAWPELWLELKSVILFWIEQGVRIFRVDNPHTKPFQFWQWLIDEIKRDHPETIFLAEAFTRPRVMRQLAKLGFTQSYTYFAWRNTKRELTQYVTELSSTELREYLRPNFWPNTPDILTEYLQLGGRPAFMARFILAATLSTNYGIYGPAFELCQQRPREPGSEEYLDSEKYQLRHWDRDEPHGLQWLISRVNQIRRENDALRRSEVAFLSIDNEQMIAYAKQTPDRASLMVVVVNLDPHNVHSGWIELPLEAFGISSQRAYQVHDLITDARYLWQGARNFVRLDPAEVPAHIFRIRHWLRTEHDFEYYL